MESFCNAGEIRMKSPFVMVEKSVWSPFVMVEKSVSYWWISPYGILCNGGEI